MNNRPSTSANQHQELWERIEELAPDAGFWQKGKPLDFTLEDVLQALGNSKHCNQVTLWPRSSRWGDFILDGGKEFGNHSWAPGEPLSGQSDRLKDFLHSLLCR